jgi:hypothetical protein
LLNEHDQWNLYLEMAQQPHAEVILDQDLAWRLFTVGIGKDDAKAPIIGDRRLGSQMLEMVSIIA